ncbi:hypothetical protein COK05_16005 [Bacillus cereus]|uniref:phospholipase D n=1 Tax=Bacillus cereus TaxID=1396 RepID=A0A2B2LPH4_BACCE|nr:phospholipase D-like domain-containing protein [Bacillus cereus]PFQ44838.1 hypothetical protein COK05_16005 [Bacillus cereus]
MIEESKVFDRRIVYNYTVDLEKTRIKKKITPLIKDKEFIKENCASLGNAYSQMHHKFIITDDVLWTGTYNLSYNANCNNWEHMIRITDKNVIREFMSEFDKMFVFSKAIQDKLNQNTCIDCGEVVEDPFEHYRIKYLTVHSNEITIKKESSSFYDEEQIMIVPEDRHNEDAFIISNDIEFEYRAECLKGIKQYEWAECCKCKTKGIKENMHRVERRVLNRVKKAVESQWQELGLASFEIHPDQITCLECLHSIIVETSKLNMPNSNEQIPFSYPSFSYDPES